MSVRSRKPVSGKEPEDRSPQSRNVSGATSGSDARLFSAPPPYLPFESEAETSVSTPLLPEEDGNELGSTPVWSIGTEGGWLRCCVEPSRAAEFLYRPTPPDGGVEVREGVPLSAFVVGILVSEGLVTEQQVVRVTAPAPAPATVPAYSSPTVSAAGPPLGNTTISRRASVDRKALMPGFLGRHPTDPLSGSLAACAEMAGGVAKGLGALPLELAKVQRKARARSHLSENPDDTPHDSDPTTVSSAPTKKGRGSNSASYAKAISLGTVKTVGHLTLASVRAPFHVQRNLAHGFFNIPVAYKDPRARRYDTISSTVTGLQAAGTGLAFGIYDGVTGLFTQPYLGGKKDGVKGVAKGFGMGLGGLVCKPAGGACGFVGFAWEGLEADVGRWREGRGAEADASSRRVGEMAQEWLGRSAAVDASDEERRRVLKLWRSMEA